MKIDKWFKNEIKRFKIMTICKTSNRMVSSRIVPIREYTQLRFITQINRKVIEMEAVSSRILVKNWLKFRPNGTYNIFVSLWLNVVNTHRSAAPIFYITLPFLSYNVYLSYMYFKEVVQWIRLRILLVWNGILKLINNL